MTENTLTRERLDAYCAMSPPDVVMAPHTLPGFTYGHLRVLIDMAMRTEQAERERDGWENLAREHGDAAHENAQERDRAYGQRDALRAVASEARLFLDVDGCGGRECAWRQGLRERLEEALAALAEPDAGGDA